MLLKAALACDDVRLEHDGALTLVGVRGPELRGRALPDGRIALARVTFVTVVGGVRGQEWLEVRHAIVPAAPDGKRMDHAARPERHTATSDDHVFLFGDAPMLFPGAGDYTVECEVTLGAEFVLAQLPIRIVAI